MPKPRVYGSPLGTEKPSAGSGRPKARDADPVQVRAAMSKATPKPFTDTTASKRTTGSSVTGPRRQRVLRRTEEAIDKMS